MRQFEITETDAKKLEAFAAAFHSLYVDKGPDAALEADDVRHVLGLALEGLGQPARDFLAQATNGHAVRPVSSNTVLLIYPENACEKVRAAAALIFSHRDPSNVVADELDDAYAALAATDFGHSPSP